MIIVTGASGTVGKEVVRELVSLRADFRTLVRTEAGAAKLKSQGLSPVLGDLDRPETLGAAFAGAERLFLLIMPSPLAATQTEQIVDVAKKAGIRHIVKLSALGVSDDTPINLASFHRASERVLEASSLEYTHLRPHFFMQNFTSNLFGYVESIKAGKLYIPMGHSGLSLVDAADIGAVAARVLTQKGHENRVYDITGPAALSFKQIADKLGAATGHKVDYVPVSDEDTLKAMCASGMPDWLAEGLVGYFRFFRLYGAQVANTVVSLTQRPGRTFDEFLIHAALRHVP